MALGDPRRRILTISEVSLLIRRSLEEQFADIWIEGEVSNLRAPGSGHLYFTLKDEQSQIRGVLFRSATPHLRFALREGLHVIVRGRVTVYELRGEYQLVVEYVEPKGIGALQLAFEQLKERLAHEGLFDQGRKRPLPLFPRSVGVVTSLTGAAIRDILSVLHRRWPILNILVMPVPVQGEGAAAEIAKAIQLLSASESVDVVIVGRGGGSLEDLWCFNEEVVVRAIAECKAPVVSAVGHETDYTLADFAADYRAATPSVAAEAVAPVLRDTVVRLHQQTERCLRAITMQVALVRMRLGDGESNMRNVRGHLQREAQRLDDLYAKLVFSAQETIFHHRRLSLDNHYALMARSPITLVKEALAVLPQLIKRLEQNVRARVALRRQHFRSRLSALHNLSPLSILSRGYSILQIIPTGHVVRRSQDVSVGENVRAQLSAGHLICSVRHVSHDS